MYRPWLPLMPAGVELRLIELPARGARFGEKPIESIERIADAVAEAIARDGGGPYALFGHSMGGSIAYEVALRRESDGAPPRALVVSATPAPHVPDRDEPFSQLPRAEFVARLLDLGGTATEVLANEELLDLMLPVLRADFAACERYDTRERPAVGCPLYAYAGARDGRVPEEDVRAWAKYTRGSFRTRVFPGDHFFLNGDRQAVISALTADLFG